MSASGREAGETGAPRQREAAPVSRAQDEPAFPPTLQAALARRAAVDPAAYARTRNHLDGAVTRLSPYLVHGLLELPDTVQAVHRRHPMHLQHKLVQEFGWREHFHHQARHLGESLFRSRHPGPLPDDAYADALPPDVREARTGVPVIDATVRTLYADGWVHNHARLWLASYLVHQRRVHWRVGADWMHAHLVDGDLAPNHGSWQWVAGTASSKPYLANAENVARHAPALASPGSAIDTGYDVLDDRARGRRPAASCEPGAPPPGAGVVEPAVTPQPPEALLTCLAPDPAMVAGRDVWLVHPWALGDLPPDLPPGVMALGVLVDEVHRRWPWAPVRWRFVAPRLAFLAGSPWAGSADALAVALAGARSVHWRAAPPVDAVLGPALARRRVPAHARAQPRLFGEPATPCASFSAWWRRVTDGLSRLDQLPGWPTAA